MRVLLIAAKKMLNFVRRLLSIKGIKGPIKERECVSLSLLRLIPTAKIVVKTWRLPLWCFYVWCFNWNLSINPCLLPRLPSRWYPLVVLPIIRIFWDFSPVGSIKNWRHLFCCRGFHLLKQRFQVHAFGLPKLNFSQRAWICLWAVQFLCRIFA